jgi:hypothetical protein
VSEAAQLEAAQRQAAHEQWALIGGVLCCAVCRVSHPCPTLRTLKPSSVYYETSVRLDPISEDTP